MLVKLLLLCRLHTYLSSHHACRAFAAEEICAQVLAPPGVHASVTFNEVVQGLHPRVAVWVCFLANAHPQSLAAALIKRGNVPRAQQK
jgi:hypothetical protein